MYLIPGEESFFYVHQRKMMEYHPLKTSTDMIHQFENHVSGVFPLLGPKLLVVTASESLPSYTKVWILDYITKEIQLFGEVNKGSYKISIGDDLRFVSLFLTGQNTPEKTSLLIYDSQENQNYNFKPSEIESLTGTPLGLSGN